MDEWQKKQQKEYEELHELRNFKSRIEYGNKKSLSLTATGNMFKELDKLMELAKNQTTMTTPRLLRHLDKMKAHLESMVNN
ncbi:MAG: hypothetical protein CMI54_04730 [Parcubacteria group bacterium]|nr:hypothetical protein [Parcubacteria group bacterium]|tara:strand:+ start:37302 stop:37544 length:243 start_codon:yes stop_codon:yes gene_type:complete